MDTFISIENELPEYGEWVLAWKPQWQRPVIAYREKTDKDGHWWQLEKSQPLIGTANLTSSITHWAPLPEISK